MVRSPTCSTLKQHRKKGRPTLDSILLQEASHTNANTAKVMEETNLQTDAVAKAYEVLITLLPCDLTSILVEFKRKFGSHISEERLPAQSMFENFSDN